MSGTQSDSCNKMDSMDLNEPKDIKVEKDIPNGATNEDTEEDPVIHEIPVYLAKDLHCYLLQYPVRPASMPYDNVEVTEAKLRPQGQQLKLKLRLNTSNTNYDNSKGEQFALNVDGADNTNKLPDEKTFPSGIMDHQVLTSSRAVSSSDRYAVGILNDNELHMTPIQSILHMRPCLSYLDKGDKTAKSEGRTIDDPDDPVEETEVLKPVTVKFARGDPDRNKKYLEKTYDYQQKKSEEEPWVETRFHQIKSRVWEEESQKMFCGKMEDEVTELDLSSQKYLDTLTLKFEVN